MNPPASWGAQTLAPSIFPTLLLYPIHPENGTPSRCRFMKRQATWTTAFRRFFPRKFPRLLAEWERDEHGPFTGNQPLSRISGATRARGRRETSQQGG